MTAFALANPAAVLDEIVTALRRDDLPRAERAMDGASDAVPGGTLIRLAELNMRRRRWRDAAWLFGRVPHREPAAELKHCLAKNLAALEVHRPAVYRAVVDVPAQGDVEICAAATGRPTIVCRRADGSTVGLSAGNDPVAAMAMTMARLRPTLDKGSAIALCGMGDGYALHALGRDATPHFLGMQQPVFVFEPDARVALHCLMIHDYAGPEGPIEQGRFWWFVGPAWAEEFEQLTTADPFVGCPSTVIGQGLEFAVIQQAVQAVGNRIVTRDQQTATRVEQYYATVGRQELAGLFGPNPPRRPRVLLLTTRFSTVLQYSTRDTAEGFRQIGWDAKVLIEPSPAHRLYQNAIRRALDEFKPDLVFQIDHLRHEHGPLFPPNVPFACWVQDHLPNLQNRAAGLAVESRDFVLTDMGPLYAARHGYPPEQMIALTKLTHVPAEVGGAAPVNVIPRSDSDEGSRAGSTHSRPEIPRVATAPLGMMVTPGSAQGSADDLTFVSNASGVPEQLAERLLSAMHAPASVLALAERCAREMLATYASGGCLPAFADVRDLVKRLQVEAGVGMPEASVRDLTASLTHPLNDALYRQQGLAWAAEAARSLGLTLGLYGNGWDQHPTLAPFARGPVQYGRPLEELTRRSRINLQIVPFSCLHQRLLDGLVAGGFFLIRRHPTDTALRPLLDLLAAHAPRDATTVTAVRPHLPEPVRPEFDRLAADAADFLCAGDGEDPVACVLAWRDAGMLVPGDDVLPRYADVSFGDAAGLKGRIQQYIDQSERRAGVVATQRASVVERFSYAAGMRRVVRDIGERLASALPCTQGSGPR